MAKQQRAEYLTRRDLRALDFIDRYRVGTSDLIARGVLGSPEQTENATRLLRKLTRRGLLERVPLGGGRWYVVLTRRGRAAVGAAPRKPRPLTEQSYPVALAIASHCVSEGLSRLTDREFRRRFPELWRPGLRSSIYCLHPDREALQLGMFVVDRGGTARRIKGKVRRLLKQRESLPAFLALVEAQRLRVTVLTGLSAQAANVRRQLGRGVYRKVSVNVALVPDLGDWMTQE